MEPFIFRKKEVIATDQTRELSENEINMVAGGSPPTKIHWETSTNGGPWHDDGTSGDWKDGNTVS